MTVTKGKTVFTGSESYASRVYPNDRYGGRLVLAVKGNPMHHEYGPMTVTSLLAFMYENKNENEKVGLFWVNSSFVFRLLAIPC